MQDSKASFRQLSGSFRAASKARFKGQLQAAFGQPQKLDPKGGAKHFQRLAPLEAGTVNATT
eukprot:1624418-Alexandrium_andersonii.AAC.1